MRKMYSENQIKDIVNKGIEDGSIHADPSTEVKVQDINAESSTLGQVIISDGEGGAEWGSIQAGMDVVDLGNSNVGTLSEENLAKVRTNNCLILRGGYFYRKSQENDSYVYYEIMPSVTTSQITESYIEITISSRGWVNTQNAHNKPDIVVNPAGASTSTLSSIQIGSTIYGVGGSEVIAYEGASLLPIDLIFESWTLHRAIKDGNILWVVLSGLIKNTSESSASVEQIFSLSLDSSITSKIYREDGTTCNNSYTSSVNVLCFNGCKGTNNIIFSVISNEANKIILKLISNDLFIAGESKRFDVRIPIFLDIGTIQ